MPLPPPASCTAHHSIFPVGRLTSGQNLPVSFVDETGDVTRNYDGSGSAIEGPAAQGASQSAPSASSVAIHNLISAPSSPAAAGAAPLASPTSDAESSAAAAAALAPAPHERRRNSITLSPVEEPIFPRELDPFSRSSAGAGAGAATATTGAVEMAVATAERRTRMPLQDILIPSPSNLPPVQQQQMGEDDCAQSLWPLSARDARLLRHYITNLGRWVFFSSAPADAPGGG